MNRGKGFDWINLIILVVGMVAVVRFVGWVPKAFEEDVPDEQLMQIQARLDEISLQNEEIRELFIKYKAESDGQRNNAEKFLEQIRKLNRD